MPGVRRYTPTGEVAEAARVDILRALRALGSARAAELGGRDGTGAVQRFQSAFDELCRGVLVDPEMRVAVVGELLLAADRAARRLAAIHGCSCDTALRQIVA
jgi:hypothetical protein